MGRIARRGATRNLSVGPGQRRNLGGSADIKPPRWPAPTHSAVLSVCKTPPGSAVAASVGRHRQKRSQTGESRRRAGICPGEPDERVAERSRVTPTRGDCHARHPRASRAGKPCHRPDFCSAETWRPVRLSSPAGLSRCPGLYQSTLTDERQEAVAAVLLGTFRTPEGFESGFPRRI
jgi:hypothetical protein